MLAACRSAPESKPVTVAVPPPVDTGASSEGEKSGATALPERGEPGPDSPRVESVQVPDAPEEERALAASVIDAIRDRLRSCFADLRRVKPGASDEIVIEALITNGHIIGINVEYDGPGRDALDKCASAALVRLPVPGVGNDRPRRAAVRVLF